MAKRFVCALFSQQLPASCSLSVCLLIAMQQCPEAVVRIGSKVWGLGKQDEEKVPGPQRWHLVGWACKGIWSMASARCSKAESSSGQTANGEVPRC